MINSITRNENENADGSSNSCLCGAWACLNSVAGVSLPDKVLCRLWVISGVVFTGDAHRSRIMADKTLCYNYM